MELPASKEAESKTICQPYTQCQRPTTTRPRLRGIVPGPIENEDIPRTIIDRAYALCNYNIDAQGKNHMTREHI